MNKKCKVCGYKFKNSNENICPECCTSREDDISCGRYTDDLHSHGCGYNSENLSKDNSGNDIFKEFNSSEKSFVDEQRSDEADNPIPSSTYNSNSPKPSSDMSSRQQKLDALKNAYLLPYSSGTINNSIKGHNYGNSAPNKYASVQIVNHKNKSNGKSYMVMLCALVIIFLAISIPILKNNTNNSENKNYTVDISMPNFDFHSTDDTMTYVDSNTGDKLITSNFTETAYYDKLTDLDLDEGIGDYIEIYDKETENSGWMTVTFDAELIPSFSDTDRYIDSLYISCISTDGEEMSLSYIIDFDIKDENSFENIEFIIPESAWQYNIIFITNNENDEYSYGNFIVYKSTFEKKYDSSNDME